MVFFSLFAIISPTNISSSRIFIQEVHKYMNHGNCALVLLHMPAPKMLKIFRTLMFTLEAEREN
jgi:hypothetical protein